MIAFQDPLSSKGQRQLKNVLELRIVRFVQKVPEFKALPEEVKDTVSKRVHNIYSNLTFLRS